ncbi:hypothetical protein [Methylobacterium soli]|uniref:Uncharacterized protein n=1 Tax=Methylobacterium soli TaxID=553447 RepID=A0A6L3SWQ0_9HYPH|nr:hypothetical protein [Methylobacterium soli]KAB1078142.1 hypothetical protein F6X53_15330 [Methylobacterium soli]
MPPLRPQRLSLALAALLYAGLLGACQPKAAAPPVATAAATPPAIAPLPQGAGCGPAIARTQAVVDSDVATGNLNQPVGARFSADLARASTACAAGREGEALHLLAAAKSRYGYP